MLDERLRLVYDLYDECTLAADIGTDHGLLPCALLETDKCKRMILTDISKKALSNAENEAAKRCLIDRISFRCGNGLSPVSETCGIISVTGMGGRTIAGIIQEGKDKLRGCGLILSAHTDLPVVRQSVMNIGYHLTNEKLCMSGGRFYIVFKAVPGQCEMSERDIRLGSLLFISDSPYLIPYIKRRIDVLTAKLRGMLSAGSDNTAVINEIMSDIVYLRERINEHL